MNKYTIIQGSDDITTVQFPGYNFSTEFTQEELKLFIKDLNSFLFT